MIQRIGEEWSKLESTTRRLASDPASGEMKAVLQAVGKVREALSAICAANVTRANFRAAIREALVPILEDEAGQLFPAITRQVADEVTAGVDARMRALEAAMLDRLGGDIDKRFSTLPLPLAASPPTPSEVPPGMLEKLAAFESRLADLARQEQALSTAVETQGERSIQTHDKLGELDSRLGVLAGQLRQAQADVGEVNFRVAELEGRQGQTDAVVLGLGSQLEGRFAQADEAQAHRLAKALHSQVEADGSRLEARLSQLDQALRAVFEGKLDVCLGTKARELEAGFREALETRLRVEIDQAGVRWQAHLQQLEGTLRAVVESNESKTDARATAMVELFRVELESTSQTLVGLLAQLEAQVPAMVEQRVAPAQATLRAETQAAVRATAEALQGRIDQLRSTLQGAVIELDERQSRELAALKAATALRLQSAVDGLESRSDKAKEELARRLVELEASVPAAVTKGTGELEARLQKEIDSMLDNLTVRITELRDLLTRVESVVPHRQAVSSIDDRLVRLEERISGVSAHVESIDSLTPELRTLADRFAGLRDQMSALSTRVEATGNNLGGLKDGVAQGLGELEALLRSGIQRWEEDQSHLLERLSAIRDTLRDQLRVVGERVEDSGGLLGKLTGRRDGGVRLSRDDWDHVSTKLEGIISGLESILSRKQPPQ